MVPLRVPRRSSAKTNWQPADRIAARTLARPPLLGEDVDPAEKCFQLGKLPLEAGHIDLPGCFFKSGSHDRQRRNAVGTSAAFQAMPKNPHMGIVGAFQSGLGGRQSRETALDVLRYQAGWNALRHLDPNPFRLNFGYFRGIDHDYLHLTDRQPSREYACCVSLYELWKPRKSEPACNLQPAGRHRCLDGPDGLVDQGHDPPRGSGSTKHSTQNAPVSSPSAARIQCLEREIRGFVASPICGCEPRSWTEKSRVQTCAGMPGVRTNGPFMQWDLASCPGMPR